MIKNKLIGIIGTRGISQIYFRELSKIGVKKIYTISKNYQNTLKNRLVLNNIVNTEIIPCKSIIDFKNKNLDLICICSPTHTHLKYIKKFLKTKSKLIVEKPLFDLKNLSEKKINEITKNIFKKNSNKLITNLPLLEFSRILEKKFSIKKKIKIIKFKYHTSGKNNYNDIAIDLLPHALSFLLYLYGKKINTINIYNKEIKKNNWNIFFRFNDIKCYFDFNQNHKKKKSILKISLDNINYLRIQKKVQSKLQNIEEYIKSGLKLKKIENVMKISINKNINKLLKNRITNNDIDIQKKIIFLMGKMLKHK